MAKSRQIDADSSKLAYFVADELVAECYILPGVVPSKDQSFDKFRSYVDCLREAELPEAIEVTREACYECCC